MMRNQESNAIFQRLTEKEIKEMKVEHELTEGSG